MRRNPLGDTSEKPCAKCAAVFPRPEGWSNRKWIHLKLCPGCEREATKERLLSRSTVGPGGCLLWPTICATTGYGQISVHDVNCRTHVVAFQLFHGPVPDGKEVCHSCDVRACWNPEHLFAGTHQENVADCVAKGRNSSPPRICGEANHNATLTDIQVAEIRALRARHVPQRRVAAMFGVSQSTVWRFAHQITRKTG